MDNGVDGVVSLSQQTLYYFTIMQREWKCTYRIADTSMLKHSTARTLAWIPSLCSKRESSPFFHCIPLHPTFAFLLCLLHCSMAWGTRLTVDQETETYLLLNLSAPWRLHRKQSQHMESCCCHRCSPETALLMRKVKQVWALEVNIIAEWKQSKHTDEYTH